MPRFPKSFVKTLRGLVHAYAVGAELNPRTPVFGGGRRTAVLSLYRHVWIVILNDDRYVAELTEFLTGESLPTSASSSLSEGPEVCLNRARAVVDLYRAGSTSALTARG